MSLNMLNWSRMALILLISLCNMLCFTLSGSSIASRNSKDTLIRERTNLVLSVDGLDREDKGLADHVLLEVQSVVVPGVRGLEDLRSTSGVLLLDKDFVLDDLRAIILLGLIPTQVSCIILGVYLDFRILRLRDANSIDVLLFRSTVPGHEWLHHVEGVWIGNAKALLVEAVTSSEAETDPVRLLVLRVVEGKLHLVDRLVVLRRVNT